LYIVNKLLAKRAANIRYFSSYFALVLVLVWSVFSFVSFRKQIAFNFLPTSSQIASPVNTASKPIAMSSLEVNSTNSPDLQPEFSNQELEQSPRVDEKVPRIFVIISLLWLLGVSLLALRLIMQMIYVERFKHRHKSKAEEWILQIVEDLRQKIAVSQAVEVFEKDNKKPHPKPCRTRSGVWRSPMIIKR